MATPDMSALLQMSYLAGMGNFNRWQAEYQQRSSMQRSAQNTQASIASAGNMTNAYDAGLSADARAAYMYGQPAARYPYQSGLIQQRAALRQQPQMAPFMPNQQADYGNLFQGIAPSATGVSDGSAAAGAGFSLNGFQSRPQS